MPATLIVEETFALHTLRLTEVEGPEPGRVFTLAKSGEAGRHPECDVPLPDGHVSRHHARFVLGQAGVWTVEDAGSANGTRVNEEEIEAATALTDGDLVRLSTVVLKVNL
ncbi:MAG: FHA domain-containing protein [Acidobacteriota bacterium]